MAPTYRLEPHENAQESQERNIALSFMNSRSPLPDLNETFISGILEP